MITPLEIGALDVERIYTCTCKYIFKNVVMILSLMFTISYARYDER